MVEENLDRRGNHHQNTPTEEASASAATEPSGTASVKFVVFSP